MDIGYVQALEKRAAWLRWAREQQAMGNIKDYTAALPGYMKVLEAGDTFFMNKKFASLVNHARQTVPDDLEFDHTWLQSPQGWLWIEEPFDVPEILLEDAQMKELGNLDLSGTDLTMKDVISQLRPEIRVHDANTRKTTLNGLKIKISAIGWFHVPEGYETTYAVEQQDGTTEQKGRTARKGATEFLCFQDFANYDIDLNVRARNGDVGKFNPRHLGFGCWSYFMLQDGDKLIDRMRRFEGETNKAGGGYFMDRKAEENHEMRWVYSAMYLMAQRLAVTFKQDTDRATRRRAEREQRPVPPFIRVISLRKLEEDKKRDKDKTPKNIEWMWQWEVRGHWRNQYFPSTDEYKPVFISAFIKGPSNRPFKPSSHKIFVARR